MPEEPVDYLNRHWQTGSPDIQQKIDELLELAKGSDDNTSLYREMLLCVIRMAQADRNRWDAKIMLQTIRELEQATARLEQFKRRRKVTVFGSARTVVDRSLYLLARDMGKILAEHDYMTITGGGAGIMEAAHVGAGLDNSLGFNITLPFEQRSNKVVHDTDHDLSFKFFFLRKLFFVKEADALVLCPGGFGTLDEALEVITLIQTGKSPVVPVILLDEPGGTYWKSLIAFFRDQLITENYILDADFNLFQLADSPEQAMQYISDFYRNYHSSRWLDGKYIVRLHQPLHAQALEQIHQEFGALCVEGGFTQSWEAGQEADEPELVQMGRLTFAFNGRFQGRLRALIDFINLPENLQSTETDCSLLQ